MVGKAGESGDARTILQSGNHRSMEATTRNPGSAVAADKSDRGSKKGVTAAKRCNSNPIGQHLEKRTDAADERSAGCSESESGTICETRKRESAIQHGGP